MNCQRCEFPKSRTFTAEINIHFAGYEGLTKPTVWVFPQVLVCPNCGFAHFSIPESELLRLVGDDVEIRFLEVKEQGLLKADEDAKLRAA